MPVTADTLAAARRMRVELDATVDAATRDMAAAWGRAWDEIVDDWSAAIDDLIAASDDGWPTVAQIARAKRAQQALQVASDALDELAQATGVRILSDVSALAPQVAGWMEIIAATQLPETGATATFSRVSPAAIRAIVQRSTQQVTSLTRPLSAEATAAMRSALIRGVAVGDHPERAAARMLARSKDGFNGGLWRARNIARTEMLQAHHDAALEFRKSNADILRGWVWTAELSKRTCPSCVANHGSIHPAGEPGPLDHQSGRCTATPLTKSWKELGFDIEEPPAIEFEDGEEWLKKQPKDVQISVLGKSGHDAWQAGRWPKEQWSQRVSSTGWRDSYRAAPVPK